MFTPVLSSLDSTYLSGSAVGTFIYSILRGARGRARPPHLSLISRHRRYPIRLFPIDNFIHLSAQGRDEESRFTRIGRNQYTCSIVNGVFILMVSFTVHASWIKSWIPFFACACMRMHAGPCEYVKLGKLGIACNSAEQLVVK